MNAAFQTPLVCHAHAPGTPDNPIDVLDLTRTDGIIRLTLRRDGRIHLDLKWPDDAEGQANAEAMMGDLARHFRPPTAEEWQRLPDLRNRVEEAAPEDARLCIQWDIDAHDPEAALALRNQVLEEAETLLDAAGLLVDWEGASVGAGTVETTFSVTDFDAAKALVWEALSPAQKGHNCRIFDEAAS